MRKKLHKVLSLLLCVILLCSMMPPSAASAAITEYEEYAYSITTFEDLKELAEYTYPEDAWVCVYYEGEEPFVVTESLTLPETMHLYWFEAALVVPSDVTFTVNGYAYLDKLTVDGTMISNLEVSVETSITVNGSLKIFRLLRPGTECVVNGLANISLGRRGELWWAKAFSDLGQLKEHIALAEAHPEYTYEIVADRNIDEFYVNITENLKIPQNVMLELDDNAVLTVNEGCTLTNEGSISSNGSAIIVNGTLDNRGSVDLGYLCHGGSDYSYASLTIGSTGSYTGTGSFWVYAGDGPRTSYEEFFTGLDLTQFNVYTYGDSGNLWWDLINISADNGGGDWGQNTFASFAELKEWIAAASGEWMELGYVSVEPLVIEESLNIPENINLSLNLTDAPVIIPEGVTLTLKGDSNYVDDLTVNGTLVIDNYMYAQGALTVNGSVILNGNLFINDGIELKGLENISLGEYGEICWIKRFENYSQLKAHLALAQANPEYRYEISGDFWNNADIRISDNLVIPENVIVVSYGDCTLTIDAGCKVTNNGMIAVAEGKIVINGILDNPGEVMVSYLDYGDEVCQASITLGTAGTYTGAGEIVVEGYGITSFEEYVIGFDLSQFEVEGDGDGQWRYWCLYLKKTDEAVGGFTDVKPEDYFAESVIWAVEKGITNGYGSDDVFAPDMKCTRGQVVTFLYRAAGEPSMAGVENPFTDVASDAYYYNAVLWAVENGITAGYGSDTTFNPDGVCNRAQVATFLWRAAGKPSMAGAANPFTDVPNGEYYYDAVLWAVAQGITNGYGSDDIFAPNTECTRGQIVTFLYRAE